jgi:hypothetical protein
MSQIEQPEYENIFCNLVFVKLILEPKINAQKQEKEPQLSMSSSPLEVTIELTIRFGLQEIEFPWGTISFGLRRGKLKMKLENGKMPIEKMGKDFVTPYQIEVVREVQNEKGYKGTVSEKPSAEASYKTTEKETCKEYPVYTEGPEEKPIWIFSPESQKKVLFGQLTKGSLGIIDITDTERPCEVEATFEIRGAEDLYITDYASLDRKIRVNDISRNKIAVILRKLLLDVILKKVQLQPYLSRVKGQI